ncbi:hypothetical protein SNE40_021156 [Patella caerulea]|uniref:Uncharacterized protein n=1 Tax=Patella caerulea TaxID=87958 RepID=A0AAN8G3G4_PATCE
METQASTSTSSKVEESELINPVTDIPELKDVYCFETDHVALKENADYQNLLKTICILQAQRINAVADIDNLHGKQREAMDTPIAFVEKLQKGEQLNFPKSMNIAPLPIINWEQYTNSTDFALFGNHRHVTRIKRQLMDGNTDGQYPKNYVYNYIKVKDRLPGNETYAHNS